MGGAAADLESALHEIARLQNALPVDRPDHHADGVFLETLKLLEVRNRNEPPVHIEGFKSLALRPTCDFGVKSFARLDQRREDGERPAARRGFHLPNDRAEALSFHR